MSCWLVCSITRQVKACSSVVSSKAARVWADAGLGSYQDLADVDALLQQLGCLRTMSGPVPQRRCLVLAGVWPASASWLVVCSPLFRLLWLSLFGLLSSSFLQAFLGLSCSSRVGMLVGFVHTNICHLHEGTRSQCSCYSRLAGQRLAHVSNAGPAWSQSR